MISSYAILLKNMGINATPRVVYNANKSVSLNYERVNKAFKTKSVKALADDSPYLKGFNGNETYIKNPAKNYLAAVKEALDRNPEGVGLYFKRGSRAHMVVAIGYIGNSIFYSDPGRISSKGLEIPFSSTWVSCNHRMSYRNLQYMVAVDIR